MIMDQNSGLVIREAFGDSFHDCAKWHTIIQGVRQIYEKLSEEAKFVIQNRLSKIFSKDVLN